MSDDMRTKCAICGKPATQQNAKAGFCVEHFEEYSRPIRQIVSPYEHKHGNPNEVRWAKRR